MIEKPVGVLVCYRTNLLLPVETFIDSFGYVQYTLSFRQDSVKQRSIFFNARLVGLEIGVKNCVAGKNQCCESASCCILKVSEERSRIRSWIRIN
jgi:hypothetical protein